jgi:protein-S-isoprenylcysteine O-methyltransferase Ste14
MIITFNFLFRILTIFLFLLGRFYWIITEPVANREKPKTTSKGIIKLYHRLRRLVFPITEIILFLQLLGWQILPFSKQLFVMQVMGFMLVLIGVDMAIFARKELGTNWVPAAEYQVKKDQELVTTGIYKYIRHPIYFSAVLSITGGELVAQSYLAFIGLVLLVGGYRQARNEEKLLIGHFGSAYKNYMKRTKMFIPFLW